MFVHLHVHSQYSILDSSASVQSLAEKAASFGMPALALTDQGNLYGAVEFYKVCKSLKIKPIIGCELFVAPESRLDKKRSLKGLPAGFSITLLAKDKTGYHNLCRLSSLAHLEGFYYTPRIDKEVLCKNAQGLICITGDVRSYVSYLANQDKHEELKAEIEFLKELFKEDLYFEIQRHQMSADDIKKDEMENEGWLVQGYKDLIARQQKTEKALLKLSAEYNIPCVATADIHYIDREDWKAHEILVNIQSGEPCEIWEKDSYGNPKNKIPNPKREVRFTHELYFKSIEQMQTLFADIPEAISNTLAIAEKCNVEIDFKTKFYPVYIPPELRDKSFSKEERAEAAASYLKKLCEEGIDKRYTEERLLKVKEKYPEKDPMQVVRDRLDYELNLILNKGMGDYLLIVWDFIHWAKSNGIPMGPGRGSGAGSIILFLIGITDIEPLRFNLFFERFINPERLSYPDIDVDICMDRRGEVIDYTVRTYGRDKVAQIITFGTMKAKMAIKDVGRVLSIPLAKVNQIAKLVPEDLNITIDKALEVDPDLKSLYESDEETKTLLDLARTLEGSVRNTGIHAAGLIVSAEPLTNLIPLCASKDSEMAVTQYSMKPVESVGMLKIDFLGLKTLTSVQCAANAVRKNHGVSLDWVNLPLDNKNTFDLLNQGKTMGIFQLESGGMQELAKQLHIDKFEEIIAVGALYRPGPMEMIPSFINRKHGRETIEIDHPLMKEILDETYGIMVYQEQVMQIASKLANYTLGEGDVLRRAMGKKDKEEMARQREKFKIGALQNHIDEETSMRIFDKVEKFASYGFNKSHAAAYGYLSYVTAFLKANYPKEWMAALMTCDRDDISKVAKVIRECQSMGIAILSPDVNESDKEFTATAQGIRFALTAIKGVGEGVVEAIIAEREKKGPFKSLYDFIRRIDHKKVGKKMIDHLIDAGSFDFTGWSRDAMLESLEEMIVEASKDQEEESKGIMNFFALLGEDKKKAFEVEPPVRNPRTKNDLFRKENELLGFFLNGHPLDEYRPVMQQLSCCPLEEIHKMGKSGVIRIAVIIESVNVRISAKSQRKFAILMISDGEERFELPIWPELYEEKQPLLKEMQLIYALVQVDKEDGELKLQCKWLMDLAAVDEKAIAECDTLYDKYKAQLARPSFNKEKKDSQSQNTNPSKSGSEKVMAKPVHLNVKIDADLVRFSEIIKLKKYFREHPGNSSVHIQFMASHGNIGNLHIDSNWGIEWTEALEKKMQAIQSIQEMICKEG